MLTLQSPSLPTWMLSQFDALTAPQVGMNTDLATTTSNKVYNDKRVLLDPGRPVSLLATVKYQQLGLSRQHWTGHQHLSVDLSIFTDSKPQQLRVDFVFYPSLDTSFEGRKTNFPAWAVVSRSRWTGHCLKREVSVRTFQPDNNSSAQHQLIPAFQRQDSHQGGVSPFLIANPSTSPQL